MDCKRRHSYRACTVKALYIFNYAIVVKRYKEGEKTKLRVVQGNNLGRSTRFSYYTVDWMVKKSFRNYMHYIKESITCRIDGDDDDGGGCGVGMVLEK